MLFRKKKNYNGNVNTLLMKGLVTQKGKRISETLFYEFYKRYDVDIRIARIFIPMVKFKY